MKERNRQQLLGYVRISLRLFVSFALSGNRKFLGVRGSTGEMWRIKRSRISMIHPSLIESISGDCAFLGSAIRQKIHRDKLIIHHIKSF
jgi:hypothetical protein